ncbi:MAG: DUF952 domain-containing protein [Planctomycetes bacterium]|jgi:uncharacterized protein (DUF952 family)|nr:DUF952 domain-containing protein [Planctomycetota bacterium]
MDEGRILHITTAAEWREAGRRGAYVPAGFARDGFIHCSRASQVLRVADFLFRWQRDLVLLEIDPALAGAPVRTENLEGGKELFPHLYGPLPVPAVVAVHPFPCRADGRFDLPLP